MSGILTSELDFTIQIKAGSAALDQKIDEYA